eukprot:COSAG02_NODE_20320_length_837_cov_14.257453_1_plen_46_part_10
MAARAAPQWRPDQIDLSVAVSSALLQRASGWELQENFDCGAWLLSA